MPALTWDQVAGYMIAAGFTISNNGPELLAIGMRESSLNTDAHNPGSNGGLCSDECGYGVNCCGFPCEDSWGIWQVNRCAFKAYSEATLRNGPESAKVVWEISDHGTNLDPWRGLVNVTEAWLDSAYEAFGATETGNPITPAAAAYLAEMLQMFPQSASLGVYVCKNIAGTDTPSDHAWGNAVDLAATGSLLNTMAAYAIENAERLHINYICFGSQSWSSSSGVGDACAGDHSTHLHASFLPQCTGVPPCMGGPASNTCGAVIGGTGTDSDCPACGPTLNPLTIAECVSCQLGKALGGILTPIFDRVFAYAKVAAGGILMMVGGAVAIYGASGSSAPALAQKVAMKVPQARAAMAGSRAARATGSPRTARKAAPVSQAREAASTAPGGSGDQWERGKIGGETVEVNRATGKVRRPEPRKRGGGPRTKLESREREGANRG